MSLSVQSNQAALLALQNLNATSDKLQSTENRISTGLQISSSKDNAAVWAIAQNQRGDIGSLSSVKMSLNRATSIADVSLAAGQTVSDLLVIMREKIVASMDTSQSAQSRTALDTDFKSILKQITQVIQNATFDNSNILDGTNSAIKFLSNADASTFITLQGQNMSLGGGIITITAGTSITTSTLAAAALAGVAAGAACGLHEQGKQPLGRTEVTRKQRRVGVDRRHQRDAPEVVPFGNHLRADQDVHLARVDRGQLAFQCTLQAGGVGVDAGDADR